MYYFSSILHSLLPFERLYIGILNPYYKYILHLQRTLTDLALIPIFISIVLSEHWKLPHLRAALTPTKHLIQHQNNQNISTGCFGVGLSAITYVILLLCFSTYSRSSIKHELCVEIVYALHQLYI